MWYIIYNGIFKTWICIVNFATILFLQIIILVKPEIESKIIELYN
jgi:hypothetical protein